MRAETSNHAWRPILITALVLASAVRLLLAIQPADELVWRLTADDAYYYLQIARNVVNGYGFTFDGLAPTNGFHPIYALLLLPLAAIAGQDAVLLVHLSLLLISVIGIAAAWPIYLIGRRLHSEDAGKFVACIWLLNPWTAIITFTGVEAAVYIFLMAWAIDRYLAWRNHPTWRHLVIAALLLGLTIMARSEGGLLLIGILLDLWLRPVAARRHAAVQSIVLTAVAMLVCAPWAIWSYAAFGTPFQVSGSAIYLLTHTDRPTEAERAFQWLAARTADFSLRYSYKLVLYIWPLTFLLPLAGVAAWRNTGAFGRVAAGLTSAKGLVFLLFPIAASFIFYNSYLWNQQHWYFAAPVLMFTLLLSIITWSWFATWAGTPSPVVRPRWVATVLACCAISFVGITYFVWNRGLYGGTAQDVRYKIAEWIAASPYRDSTLAATDNGILGYYCDCNMVNLEGVVNNEIYRYHAERGYSSTTMAQYMADNGIEFVVLPSREATLSFGDITLQRLDSPDELSYSLYALPSRSTP